MNHERDSASQEEPGRIPGLDQLSMHEEPQRDLWPGIASRIAVRRSRNRRYAVAAAACTVLAFSAMLTLRLNTAPESAPHAPIAAPAEYVAMTSPSARGYDRRANRALIKANLRLTQVAEGEVRKALRQKPDDPSLHRLLESTREQKRELDAMLVADRQ